METYHKINAPFKRYPDGKLMVGDWSLPEFGYLADNEWEFTEKVDGTNIRIGVERIEDALFFEFRGRTDRADIPRFFMNFLKDTFLDDKMQHRIGSWMVEHDIESVVLFGEGYGPKIQKGERYREDHSFVLFDVKVGDWWLLRKDVNEVADTLQIQAVPSVGSGTILDGILLVKRGLQSQWGDFEAEGVVAVPKVPLFNRRGERIITKIKAKDFK